MTVAPGMRFGQDALLSPPGASGNGEVWVAEGIGALCRPNIVKARSILNVCCRNHAMGGGA